MAIEIVTVELGCFVLHDHVANMTKRVYLAVGYESKKLKYHVDQTVELGC